MTTLCVVENCEAELGGPGDSTTMCATCIAERWRVIEETERGRADQLLAPAVVSFCRMVDAAGATELRAAARVCLAEAERRRTPWLADVARALAHEADNRPRIMGALTDEQRRRVLAELAALGSEWRAPLEPADEEALAP